MLLCLGYHLNLPDSWSQVKALYDALYINMSCKHPTLNDNLSLIPQAWAHLRCKGTKCFLYWQGFEWVFCGHGMPCPFGVVVTMLWRVCFLGGRGYCILVGVFFWPILELSLRYLEYTKQKKLFRVNAKQLFYS